MCSFNTLDNNAVDSHIPLKTDDQQLGDCAQTYLESAKTDLEKPRSSRLRQDDLGASGHTTMFEACLTNNVIQQSGRGTP